MSTNTPPFAGTLPVPESTHVPPRPRVVVVGAGFGGLEAARRLAKLPVEVVLIDRHNYHLFTPLLYQVATAGLAPEEIAHPVRGILRGLSNIRFLVAEVRGVDLKTRLLQTEAGELSYDFLILAAGSTNSFFGMETIKRDAYGLKDLDEAMLLRNHILAQFEAAAWEPDSARRRSLLTFVVVGGGPTGVEFSGALHELVSIVMPKDYPQLDFSQVKVILLEASDRLLSMLAPKLQRSALEELTRKGVEVRLNTAVERIVGTQLLLKGGDQIGASTVIWAAGVQAAALADTIGLEQGRQNRLKVGPTLQLAGHPEVFAIGDLAAFEQNGQPLPMVAPVAIQGAQQVARNIGRMLKGDTVLPLRYRDKGTMATIGRKAAVAEIGPLKLTGFLAWLVWLTLHLITLIGFRNRVLVLVNWAWDYLFYDRAVRLILGEVRTKRATGSAEVAEPD